MEQFVNKWGPLVVGGVEVKERLRAQQLIHQVEVVIEC